jgi:NADPH:quinone reductase-like Zn-dependent oxidoreductase
MRAYAYLNRIGLDDLRLIERPDPQLGPFDILLRMRAAAQFPRSGNRAW